MTMAGSALSQTVPEPGELAPDRPGFGESTEVVGKLVTQVEGGFALDRGGRGGDRETAYAGPQTLLRFGISRRVELRFEGEGYVWQTARPVESLSRASGLSDHTVGLKFKLHDEGKFGPALSLIGNLSIPVGNEALTSGAVDPEVKLGWSKNLPKAFSISGTFNVASVSDDKGRVLDSAFSISAGHRLAGGFAGTWEVYRVNLERGQGTSWVAASGVTHGLGQNAQLDLSAGHTVAGARSGWFLAAGFVYRHPHLKAFL